MRRDDYADILIADAAVLRGAVGRDGGFKFFRTSYMWKRPDPGLPGTYFGEVGEQANAKLAISESAPDDDGWGVGLGVALAVWAGRAPSGGPVICDEYVPDDVGNLQALWDRAKQLRMDEHLKAGLALLRRADDKSRPTTFPVPVVLLVRRPVNLIGSDSDIELCPYILPFTPGKPEDPQTAVVPLAHSHAIAPALLKRMAGEDGAESWALLGCGSLGSKIALHRARAGSAPVACADKSWLRAHNAARHALYPRKRVLQFGWAGAKAQELNAAIQGLGQASRPLEADHREMVAAIGSAEGFTSSWLVNTTASTVVREDLAHSNVAVMPRVVEACLFDAAKLGYVSTEGRGRNPNTAELLGEFYEVARAEDAIGAKLYRSGEDVAAVSIGQGCASVTMVVNDAKISAMAAPMSEIVASLSSDVETGTIDLLVREGLGVRHQAVVVRPCRRVLLEGLDGWTVSVSAGAYDAVVAEVAEHPKTETGGVLIGWVSMIARTIYVTSVMEAPPDSIRKATEFELGTEGLRGRLEALWNSTAGALVCVGTWHSHLGAATPSTRDKLSAALVGLHEPRPMAFLIHGTDGLRAISAAAPITKLPEPV